MQLDTTEGGEFLVSAAVDNSVRMWSALAPFNCLCEYQHSEPGAPPAPCARERWLTHPPRVLVILQSCALPSTTTCSRPALRTA